MNGVLRLMDDDELDYDFLLELREYDKEIAALQVTIVKLTEDLRRAHELLLSQRVTIGALQNTINALTDSSTKHAPPTGPLRSMNWLAA